MKKPGLYLSIFLLTLAAYVGCSQTANTTKEKRVAPDKIAQSERPTIKEMRDRLDEYLGKEVVLEALYGDPRRECVGIPHKRSDWMIYDETSAMYVSGVGPGLERYGKRDWGTPLEVRGIVKQTKSGTPYISAIEVRVLNK